MPQGAGELPTIRQLVIAAYEPPIHPPAGVDARSVRNCIFLLNSGGAISVVVFFATLLFLGAAGAFVVER